MRPNCQHVRHKRGDTFELLLLLPEADYPDGYFLLWDVASQIRYRDELVSDLTVEWTDPAADTRGLRLSHNTTELWPLGELEVDVQLTRQSDGYTRSTETIVVEVVRDITILP